MVDEWLRGAAPVHVTQLAAACLRTVDARSLDACLDDAGQCRRYRGLRDKARGILDAVQAPGNILHEDTLAKLRELVAPGGRIPTNPVLSLAARAIAQALHDARASQFWSYFSAWPDARKLVAGDPFPVPTATTLYDIYRKPLRLSPNPDNRDTPHSLCPGGYRGLPSLRLVPECKDAEIYLDPRLGQSLRPMGSRDHGAGTVAFVVPAPTLAERYEYKQLTNDDADRGFHQVRPRPAAGGVPGGVARLIEDVTRILRSAGDRATIAVMPELTSTPEVDNAIGDALTKDQLGSLQLVVAGSAWISPPSKHEVLGDNRSTTWTRDGHRHHHFKFSWYHDKNVGRELTAHRGKRITILAGPHLTFTTLICKDALETWVRTVLEELRVRLVIVASCNHGVGTYRPFAESVSDLGWATVVLANIPPEPTASGARGGDHLTAYALVSRPATSTAEETASVTTEILRGFNVLKLLQLDASWIVSD